MYRRCFVFVLFLCTPLAARTPRERLDLNGAWESLRVAELDTPPEEGDWQPYQVPGTLLGYNNERVWFRRSFTLPKTMQGQRITLQFDGVKYNSRIFVNGKRVGGCFNGYDAFSVDATDAVRFDAPNELMVGCHDWTGVFIDGKYDFSKKPAWQRPRRYVVDQVIAPIGGHYDSYGIWGDVTLLAHPAVYIEDLFIKPSVRHGELVVEYTVANESAEAVKVGLTAAVEDQNADVLTLVAAPVHIPVGESVKLSVTKKWPNARYWSHEDPYLYHLRTELSTGDVLRTRFGFREFWIEGHRYVLNGSKIDLLGSSWWPPTEPLPRDEIKRRWQALRDAGVICFRTHTQPWRRVHYDVADEVGLLMIIEGAMWHDPYCTAYDNPTYWDNYAKMIHAMIDREKNRPSVIMWSMENEAYAGAEKTRLAETNLARVGKMAKAWDPTRPIYFESDGDPGGVADAIGMHYVHEYPAYTCWPNEAYWLEKPFKPHTWFGVSEEPFLWKKDKPLYIGEFLWVPSGTPANHTVFFGDDAYRDLHEYTRLGKAEAWKMQILAFRHLEAGGMCPWTVGEDLDESNPLYRAHQYAYQPLAAYCLDYDGHFFSGETVKRRVEVFSNVLTASKLTLNWTLSQDKTVVDRGNEVVSLPPGEKKALTVVLHMPAVKEREDLEWRLTLTAENETVFDDTHAYSVFPQRPLPRPTHRIGLFDPSGATAKLLRDSEITFQSIASLEQLGSSVDVLMIGDDALVSEKRSAPVIGRVDPQRAAVMEFVAAGGRVLVLKQTAYPEGLFDLNLTQQKSTMTFPLAARHPALRGLKADDLKFWRGDHMVAEHEPPRPISGAMVPIVVSGSKAGIANAPLLERPLGRGTIVHSQLKLVEKSAIEPAAAVLLGNLIRYLDDYVPRNRKTAVLSTDAEYLEFLKNVGLRFDNLATASSRDVLDYALILCHGDAVTSPAFLAKLSRYVTEGGQLLLHRPSPALMNRVSQALKLNVMLQPGTGFVRRVDGMHPLLDAIAREDLYWSVKQPGLSWARQPLSRDMIDGVCGVGYDPSGATAYDITSWALEGKYVTANPLSVLFASAGTAMKHVDFDESGRYAIGIRARGTACKGVYPIAEIRVDGELFGSIPLSGDDWATGGVSGVIAKGRHAVTVSFVNDASAPPDEDRNLEVAQVLISRDRRANDVVELTSPPAVVAIDCGAGRVVVDRLRWDTEKENGRKASRYACSMLTALDADFMPRSAVTLECDQMTPQPDMKFFDSRGGIAYMGCNGYIKTTVQVAESKRYTIDVIASGDPSDDIYPLVEFHLDGKKVGDVQLTTGGWRPYSRTIELEQGEHEFSLVFVNDHASPTGDRNLRLDKVVFYQD